MTCVNLSKQLRAAISRRDLDYSCSRALEIIGVVEITYQHVIVAQFACSTRHNSYTVRIHIAVRRYGGCVSFDDVHRPDE